MASKPKTIKDCRERVAYALTQAYLWYPNNPVAHAAHRAQWENVVGELQKLRVLPADFDFNPWGNTN